MPKTTRQGLSTYFNIPFSCKSLWRQLISSEAKLNISNWKNILFQQDLTSSAFRRVCIISPIITLGQLYYIFFSVLHSCNFRFGRLFFLSRVYYYLFVNLYIPETIM